MRFTRSFCLAMLCATGTAALAQPPESALGAGLVPVILPAQATAIHAFAGVPELGLGFRQGFGGVELDALARFDYLDLGLAATGRLKLRVAEAPFPISAYGGLGLSGDTGSTYFHPDNFGYFAVRLEAGAIAAQPLAPTLRLVETLSLTWDLFTHPVGGNRLEPLAGAGAELSVTKRISLFALGQLGVDWRKRPGQDALVRLGYGLRIGIGFRLF